MPSLAEMAVVLQEAALGMLAAVVPCLAEADTGKVAAAVPWVQQTTLGSDMPYWAPHSPRELAAALLLPKQQPAFEP